MEEYVLLNNIFKAAIGLGGLMDKLDLSGKIEMMDEFKRYVKSTSSQIGREYDCSLELEISYILNSELFSDMTKIQLISILANAATKGYAMSCHNQKSLLSTKEPRKTSVVEDTIKSLQQEISHVLFADIIPKKDTTVDTMKFFAKAKKAISIIDETHGTNFMEDTNLDLAYGNRLVNKREKLILIHKFLTEIYDDVRYKAIVRKEKKNGK